MHRALKFAALVTACLGWQTAAVRADACTADQNGGLVCGTGKDAVRIFDQMYSPSREYAFAWRSGNGLPQGDDIPNDAEDVLVRVKDGAVLARLGGTFWDTGRMRANRFDLVAAWSPDNKAVVEVANARWDSESFAYYRIDGATAVKLDLLELVKSAALAKAKLPAKKRSSYSFRIRDEYPVTLDAQGHLRFTAGLFIPKSDQGDIDYKVQVDIVAKAGKPAARIVSVQRTKTD